MGKIVTVLIHIIDAQGYPPRAPSHTHTNDY